MEPRDSFISPNHQPHRRGNALNIGVEVRGALPVDFQAKLRAVQLNRYLRIQKTQFGAALRELRGDDTRELRRRVARQELLIVN